MKPGSSRADLLHGCAHQRSRMRSSRDELRVLEGVGNMDQKMNVEVCLRAN